MPITSEQNARLSTLRADFVTPEQMRDLIGVFPRDQYTYGRFRQYAQLLARRRESERNGMISRFVFEGFLQHYRLLPMKTGAVQLGMTTDSLGKTVDGLISMGWIDVNDLTIPADLVDESLIRSIHTLFPSLNGVMFGDHSDFCRELHAAIRNEINVDVQTVLCSTSQAKGDNPVDIANSYCLISHEPMSIRNEIMMDFGKPISLPPDVCSRKFIEENRTELEQYTLTRI